MLLGHNTYQFRSQESFGVPRIKDFLKINPLMFTGSKVEEDPLNFIDELWKILTVLYAIATEGI